MFLASRTGFRGRLRPLRPLGAISSISLPAEVSQISGASWIERMPARPDPGEPAPEGVAADPRAGEDERRDRERCKHPGVEDLDEDGGRRAPTPSLPLETGRMEPLKSWTLMLQRRLPEDWRPHQKQDNRAFSSGCGVKQAKRHRREINDLLVAV